MADRDRIRWDDEIRWEDSDAGTGVDAGRVDGNGDDGWDGGHVVPSPSPRINRVTALVLLAVFLATVVLCCVAAREAGQLLWLEPPPP